MPPAEEPTSGQRKQPTSKLTAFELSLAVLGANYPIHIDTLTSRRIGAWSSTDNSHVDESRLRVPDDISFANANKLSHIFSDTRPEALLQFAKHTLHLLSVLQELQPRMVFASRPTSVLITEVVQRLPESIVGFESLRHLSIEDGRIFHPYWNKKTMTIDGLDKLAAPVEGHGPIVVVSDGGSRNRLALFDTFESTDFDVKFADFGDDGAPWQDNREAMTAGEYWIEELRGAATQLAASVIEVIQPKLELDTEVPTLLQ